MTNNYIIKVHNNFHLLLHLVAVIQYFLYHTFYMLLWVVFLSAHLNYHLSARFTQQTERVCLNCNRAGDSVMVECHLLESTPMSMHFSLLFWHGQSIKFSHQFPEDSISDDISPTRIIRNKGYQICVSFIPIIDSIKWR